MTQHSPSQALVRTLVSYLPPAVARAIHASPEALRAPREDRAPAAVLLADVSGFTALTEALATRGAGGVEELTTLLNAYFSRMIGVLEAAGGEVVQFSGDALVALFAAEGEGDLPATVAVAYGAAQAMQAAMADFAHLATSVGELVLAMKIAIGAGSVLAMSIGGEKERWQYLIAGSPMRQVAEGEHRARRGEIVLSDEAAALLARSVGPVAARPKVPAAALDWSHADAATVEALSLHIPRAITARLATEERWLAELRRMSVLFIGVTGLEERGEATVGYFHACMRALQEVTYRHEGSLNKFQVDDKGVIGLILFGAPPMAHADDPLRAVRCALALRQAAELLGLSIAIGVTTDQVFAGPVGSPTRREYTVMGNAVNLAARLMAHVQSGQGAGVLCDFATYQAAHAAIHWETLAPITVKGKAAPARVYAPLGSATPGEARTLRHGAGLPLVGRQDELASLEAAMAAVAAGASRVLFLDGEEGIGKSRLLEELTRLMRERGVVGLLGAAESLERERPYNAWRELVGSYFDLELYAPGEPQAAHVVARIGQIAPHLAERAPLLNDILGLGLPETPLTAGLEPERRQASLQALVVELLRLWAGEEPLVLILEDAHWLDTLSWHLTALVARSLAGAPVLIVCACRSDVEPAAPAVAAELRAAPNAAAIALGPLSLEQTASLGAARLGVARLADNLARLIAERAAGNPLVTEELALSLREEGAVAVEGDTGVLLADEDELRLPATLQSLVLSRIDHLPPAEQFTLKVAAVIGTAFSAEALGAIYPEPIAPAELAAHLEALAERALVTPDEGPWSSHRFRQTVLREMTYNTLLPGQRSFLHRRVAEWYERRPPEALGGVLPQLAHHWRHAGDRPRERHYAAVAARKFAAEYANDAALGYTERALQLEPGDAELLELRWLRHQIFERTGRRAAQRDELALLDALLDAQGTPVERARLANAWAAYHRDVSEYPAALARVARAEALARAHDDPAAAARSLTIRGEIYEYQGDTQAARDAFREALALYRAMGYRRGEANNLSKLGNLLCYMGEFTTAREHFREALELRRAIADADEGAALANLGEVARELGDWGAAADYWAQALAASRRVGDRRNEAIVLAQMGFGEAGRGHYGAALASLGQAAQTFRAIGERRRVAETLNDLGMVQRDIGRHAEARAAFEEALAIQTGIGDARLALFTALNLGRQIIADDPARSAALYALALEAALAADDRLAEAYTRSYLGHLAERRGDLPAAAAAYQAAARLRAALGLPTAEEQAGLARVALLRDDPAAALALARACLAYLEADGPDGLEFPFEVYLSCYDALRAAGHPAEARRALAAAHELLMARAAAVEDPAIRASMLANVPAHRRIVAETQSGTSGTTP